MANTQTLTEVQTVHAEVVETKPLPQSGLRRNFIAEDGKVNLAVLDDTQLEKCRKITKNLSPQVIGSVSNYGIELQTKLADSGKSFLTATRSSRTGEIGNIMNDLLVNLNKINIKDVQEPNAVIRVLQKIPIINAFVPSIKKTLLKYQTIEEGIKQIEENIKATQLAANADNNSLQLMFDDTVNGIKQMEDYIVAGTLAIEDAKSTMAKMQQEGANSIELNDYQAYVNSLEKKIHDLQCVRQIAKHNLMEIRMLQQNNIIACDNAQSMISLTVPAFRNQMAIAVALQHQKDNVDVYNAVRQKTNEAIVANSQALYDNTVAIAQANNEAIISIESIQKSAENIKNAIEKVREIERTTKAKREEESRKFAELERNIDAIASGNVGLLDTAEKGVSL